MKNTPREKAKVLSAGMKAIWPDLQGDPERMEDVFLRLVEAVQMQGHYIVLISIAPGEDLEQAIPLPPSPRKPLLDICVSV